MKRLVPWVFYLVILAVGWTCAPDFAVTVFSYARHPDFPRTKYLNGDLGVFLPTYARSYLVIAYRHMTGAGFDAREREQVLDYWKDRASGDWDRTAVDWKDHWERAADRVIPSGAPRKLLTEGVHAYSQRTQSFEVNCAEDAFRNALHTLEARETQFGRKSEAVREWVRAQRLVFTNCDSAKGQTPAPADPSLPAIIRLDRDYQIAAAHFYSGRYEAARDQFAKIAADRASPWRTIAPYLVVRTLLRMSVEGASQVPTHARRILADPSLAPIHGMTWNLLRRSQIEKYDLEYFHELARQLSSKGQGNGLREELWAFTTMFDHLTDTDQWEHPRGQTPDDLAPFQRDDLADWVLTYQGLRPQPGLYAYAQWKRTRSPQWLIAALAHATAQGREADELIDAAASVPPASPAFLTAAFHRHRLMIETGNKPQVIEELDALLARPAPKSAVNMFRGLRMRAAPGLGDFLRFAVRRPVMLTTTMNEGETPPWRGNDEWYQKILARFDAGSERLDRDSARLLNVRTPLRLLADASKSNVLPQNLRRELRLTALVRAVLLDRRETVADLVPALAEPAQELSAYVNAYRLETTDDGRRFAAAILLLHSPEARPYVASGISRQTKPGKIDSYRDNWWCPVTMTNDLDSVANVGEYEPRPPIDAGAARFLSPDDIAQASKEFTALTKTGSATDSLGRIVVDYAMKHPGDPRLAEALFLVIRSNRYGCDRFDDAHQAREALRLLKRRFAASDFARRGANYYSPSEHPETTPQK